MARSAVASACFGTLVLASCGDTVTTEAHTVEVCPTSLTECSGSCVDTSNDPSNCGSCGHGCSTGEYCAGGTCTSVESGCPTGQIDCGGTCTNTDIDSGNCGSCGNACDDGEKCDGSGACALTCQPGLIDCFGTCINPDTDNTYCGASGDCLGAHAGTTCGDGEKCDGSGSCALTCQSGLVPCAGTCIDPNSNPAHCGASGDCLNANAGTDCDDTEACIAGQCYPVAPGSCLDILALGLSDGVHWIDPNFDGGYEVYCDITNGGWTYEELGFGQYNQAYAGYDLLTNADFQSVQVQEAFLWAYNAQGGLVNLNPGWSSNNCCFKNGTTAHSYLAFGTIPYMYPADNDGGMNCNGTYSDAIMKYWFANSGPTQEPPLPSGYFTTYPPSAKTGCSDNNNPGFFFKRYQ